MHGQFIRPVDILRSYGKIAIRAHAATNCLTEVMLPEAEQWAEAGVNLKGPLAGIPVSLKDSIAVAGFDVSVGYSRNTGRPCAKDGSMVRLLKDAGTHATSSHRPQEPADLTLSRRRSLCQDQSPRHPPLL